MQGKKIANRLALGQIRSSKSSRPSATSSSAQRHSISQNEVSGIHESLTECTCAAGARPNRRSRPAERRARRPPAGIERCLTEALDSKTQHMMVCTVAPVSADHTPY